MVSLSKQSVCEGSTRQEMIATPDSLTSSWGYLHLYDLSSGGGGLVLYSLYTHM